MSGEVKEEIGGERVWKDSEIYDYDHYYYFVVLDWLQKCRLNPGLCTRWVGIPPLSHMSNPFFTFYIEMGFQKIVQDGLDLTVSPSRVEFDNPTLVSPRE